MVGTELHISLWHLNDQSCLKGVRRRTKSPCNYTNRHEKTTVMRGGFRLLLCSWYWTVAELDNSFVFALRENIPPPAVLALNVEHYEALSFCMNSKPFNTELCSHGDRKVLNQHVPLTEAEILIFPELLFTSSDKSQREGLSFAPATHALLSL